MADMHLVIAGIILAIAAYTDMRTREVPDILSYIGIAAGLGLASLGSISTADWTPILRSIIGLGTGAAAGSILYYTGQWGGGDAKLLMALGSLLGIQFSLNNTFVAFAVNMIFVGALYGVAATVILGAKDWKGTKKQMRKRMTASRKYLIAALVAGVASVMLATQMPSSFSLIAIVTGIAIPMLALAGVAAKSVEETVLRKPMKPSQLTIGDWLAEPVKVKGKLICATSNTGLDDKSIKSLKSLARKGVLKEVVVKNGIPFVPCFFLTYLVTLYAGNIALLLTKII